MYVMWETDGTGTGVSVLARGLESSNSEAVAGLLQGSLGYRERPSPNRQSGEVEKIWWGVIGIHCSTGYPGQEEPFPLSSLPSLSSHVS